MVEGMNRRTIWPYEPAATRTNHTCSDGFKSDSYVVCILLKTSFKFTQPRAPYFAKLCKNHRAKIGNRALPRVKSFTEISVGPLALFPLFFRGGVTNISEMCICGGHKIRHAEARRWRHSLSSPRPPSPLPLLGDVQLEFFVLPIRFRPICNLNLTLSISFEIG